MSLLRFDVTTNDWVIFAPERIRRPHEFRQQTAAPAPGAASLCPFCPGNEHVTGPEIYAVRDGTAPDTPGWQVRVVPNKFPVLRIEEDHRRMEEGPFFRFMGGCGAHEVMIESPDHTLVLADQPVEQVDLMLRTLQVRFNDLLKDGRFQTIVVFKNHGEGAGTSLRHPHWQLIATPVVPRLLRTKHAVATEYFDRTGDCLYCVLLKEELADGRRVVAVNDQFAAILPYASRVPFETWVLPREHRSSFGNTPAEHFRPLAELLRGILGKLRSGLNDPDFNLTINTAPRGDEQKGYFLWHIEILPRLTQPAGFELGSGMSINTVWPEDAAKFLRPIEVR